MPSTTPNYGWTYPISSDDLNAGATSVGSLATGADASLKAEADARAAADADRYTKAQVDAGLATKWGIPATGNVVVTTTFGEFNIGARTAANTICMDGDASAGGGPKFITSTSSGGLWGNFCATLHTGANAGSPIRVTYLGW